MQGFIAHKSQVNQTERELAALAYLWFFSLIVFFTPLGRHSFVRHHAKQGVFLFFMSIIIYFLPGYLRYLNIVVLFFIVFGVIESIQGSLYRLPIMTLPKTKFFELSFYKSIFSRSSKSKKSKIDDVKQKSKLNSQIKNKMAGLKKSDWSSETLDLLVYLEGLMDKNFEKESFGASISFAKKGTIRFFFGNVSKKTFDIAFPSDVTYFPGDDHFYDWKIKHFFIENLDRKYFKSFMSFLIK